MDKDRKMRCKVCIKEIVFGYVDPNKDYILCDACAFKDEDHSAYYEKMHKMNKETNNEGKTLQNRPTSKRFCSHCFLYRYKHSLHK